MGGPGRGAVVLGLALAAPAGATNFLVVIADDLGVDKVGATAGGFKGYTDAALYLPATPTVDALAAAGLTFTRAWADPVCSPSRFSLQTGQHAFRAGIGRPLGEREAGPDWSTWSTLAGGFTDGGYATALFGKWHIGAEGSAGTLEWPAGVYPEEAPNPRLAGFGAFAGILGSDVATNDGWEQVRWLPAMHTTVSEPVDRYVTTELVDEAAAWIAGQSDPWLVLLPFTAPHRAADGNYHYGNVDPACVTSPGLRACLDGSAVCEEIPAAYAGLVECMDTALGELLAAMDPATLADTLVVFTSDNGTPREAAEWRFADPDEDGVRDAGRGKGSPYESGVHVPLIVAEGRSLLGEPALRIVEPGREVTLPVQLMGLYPTLLKEAVGVAPTGVDARGFSDCFGSADPTCGRSALPVVYAESWYPDAASAGSDREFGAALAAGDHTLIVVPGLDAKGQTCRDTEVFRRSTDYWQTSPLRAPTVEALLKARVDAIAPVWMAAWPWC